MNPATYCAVTSCSEKDWEVFGSIALLAILIVVVFGIISVLTEKYGKDDKMK